MFLTTACVAVLFAVSSVAQAQNFNSLEDARNALRKACPAADQSCIVAECDRQWTDPVSALWITTYLADDDRPFVDDYLKLHYGRERDGNVKIVLLSKLMNRNKATNLPFVIGRLHEISRTGREGDRPGLMALRYLQSKVLLEYKCEDKRFPGDRRYRKWVSGVYLNWFKGAPVGEIEYDPALGAFVIRGDKPRNIDSHFDWASGCRAETYPEN